MSIVCCRANSTYLRCVTTQQVANSNDLDVEVNFGGHQKLSAQTFTYVNDPEISQIEPKLTILR